MTAAHENQHPLTDPTARGARLRGPLLLADISGYTGFLQGVADAHRDLIVEAPEPPLVYTVMSSLLDGIVDAIAPVFRLDKLEGDAVFAVGPGPDGAIEGTAVLDCLRACYAAFRERLAEARADWTCECGSCVRVTDLDLKFVLHFGDYVVQRMAGREELLGPDVNVAHRLLKNHAREVIGPRPYALLTDAAVREMRVPTEGMVAGTEAYDGLPPVPVHILALA